MTVGRVASMAVGPAPRRASFWVAVVGALVMIVATALFFTVSGQLADQLLAASKDPGFTAAEAHSSTTRFLWTLLVVSVVLGGLQGWFTWRTATGKRGFRTAATIVLAFSIVFVLAVGSYLQLAGAVLLLVSVVLLYVPSSNAFFRGE